MISCKKCGSITPKILYIPDKDKISGTCRDCMHVWEQDPIDKVGHSYDYPRSNWLLVASIILGAVVAVGVAMILMFGGDGQGVYK